MQHISMAENSYRIFESVRNKAGQTIAQIADSYDLNRKQVRGNIVDLIKRDLIWVDKTKRWVNGRYYLTNKAEHLLDEMGLPYDEATFD